MKASIKVQVNDWIKRLLEREYSSVDDLKENICQAFELKSSKLKLTYQDEDNDLVDIISTEDFKVAIDNAVKRNINLKIKVDIVN